MTGYRPLTDEELNAGTAIGAIQFGKQSALRMWEQCRRANALAEAVKILQHYHHIEGHGQNCWGCKAEMNLEDALRSYLGEGESRDA